MMLNVNEDNEERELELINEIETKEAQADSLISELKKILIKQGQMDL
jgi:uncharacterized protein Yka (UPF0111/DUF47 family)